MEKFLITLLIGFALGLLISLISPRVYHHYLPKKPGAGKRKILVDRPALILIFLILIAATAFSWQTTRYTASLDKNTAESQYVEKPYPVYNSQYDLIQVLDQTTLDLDSKGKISRVKLIGVSSFTEGKTAEQNACFAKEADARLNQYLSGKKIELEADAAASSNNTGSVLPRYIVVNDENINEKMIGEGYAIETAGTVDYRYRADFQAAQENAKSNKLGFWSGNICPVVAQSPVNSPKKSNPSPSSSPQPSGSTAAPDNNSRGNSGNNGSQPCPAGLPVVTPLLNGLLNRC